MLYAKEPPALHRSEHSVCVRGFIVSISETSRNIFLCVSLWFPIAACLASGLFFFQYVLESGHTSEMGTFLFYWTDLNFCVTILCLCIIFIYWKKNLKLLPVFLKSGFEEFLYMCVLEKIILHFSFIYFSLFFKEKNRYM